MNDLLWKAQDCADFLRQEKSYFLRFTCHKDGFPKRLPGKGKPLWIAQQVIAWRVGPENMGYFKKIMPNVVQEAKNA